VYTPLVTVVAPLIELLHESYKAFLTYLLLVIPVTERYGRLYPRLRQKIFKIMLGVRHHGLSLLQSSIQRGGQSHALHVVNASLLTGVVGLLCLQGGPGHDSRRHEAYPGRRRGHQ